MSATEPAVAVGGRTPIAVAAMAGSSPPVVLDAGRLSRFTTPETAEAGR